MQLKALKGHLERVAGAARCKVLRSCLFVGHRSLCFYAIHCLEEGMNRMLTTVPEMTKSGGVISFDKWSGYEQQYGSQRPKQVRNMDEKT